MFTNDNPLNETDPFGECGGLLGFVCVGWDNLRHSIAAATDWVVAHPAEVAAAVGLAASIVATGGADIAAVGAVVAESSTWAATATTVSEVAGYTSAVIGIASCGRHVSVAQCTAAVAGAALAAGGDFIPEGVVTSAGKKVLIGTYQTGLTSVDVSITLAGAPKKATIYAER